MHNSREIRLKQRPVGVPDASTFEMAEVSVPDPSEGEILVRNRWMSVDPYMRGRMIDRKSYLPPFEVGKALQGGAVGEVIASRHDGFAVGDHVLGMLGWRELYLSDGSGLQKVDGSVAPLSAYLGILGMPGLTAHYGLLQIGEPKEGETVFVSGAAGAVGAAVCQIARLKGCRVVASAGSPEKIAWLTEEAGVDEAFDYKTVGSVVRALAQAAPGGVDVYFDNVGGDHLEAALHVMNPFGRIVACGSISTYNATEPPCGPGNLFHVVTKRLLMQGFIVSDHYDHFPAFAREMAGWLASGRVKWKETVVEGLANAPDAFIGLFSGANLGKMVVRLED